MPKLKKSLTLLALLSCLVSCSKSNTEDSSTTSKNSTSSSISNNSSNNSSSISNNSSNNSSSTSSLTGNAKFLNCKDNTINNSSYQYDYDLSASIKYESSAANVSAQVASISGTTYYNGNSTDTKYLQKKITKAGLLFESTSYTYTSGDSLIKLNENSTKYSISSIDDATKIDFKNYSFNKLINNVTDSFLDNGQDLTDGKYKLNYKVKFQSQLFTNIAGCIDVNYFLDVINKYQSTVKFDIDSYVTYNGNYFDTFYIKFDVVVKDIVTITLKYTQNYKNVGQNFNITLPDLTNQHITSSEINKDISAVVNAIVSYREQDSTSYDYKVKTAVDHGPSKSNPLGCAVNSTSKGDARQVRDNLTTYYNNDLEVDSDYKNSDQYTSDCVKDYHVYRAKLNDGNDTVRDEIVRTLSNDFTDATDASDEIDAYYFLMPYTLLNGKDYVAISNVVEDEKKDLITYTFGLSDKAAKATLDFYNSSIRINGSHDVDAAKDPGHIDVFQVKDSFSIRKGEIVIKVKKSTGALQSIETNVKGYYEAVEDSVKSPGANTFVKFELNSTLDNFDTSKTYTIPTKDADIR